MGPTTQWVRSALRWLSWKPKTWGSLRKRRSSRSSSAGFWQEFPWTTCGCRRLQSCTRRICPGERCPNCTKASTWTLMATIFEGWAVVLWFCFWVFCFFVRLSVFVCLLLFDCYLCGVLLLSVVGKD